MRVFVSGLVVALVVGLAGAGAAPRPAYAAGKPEVSVVAWDASEASNPRQAVLTVMLDHKARTTVKVSWRTADGTAKAGSDYRATSGTVVFKPGARRQDITVRVLNDGIPESSEYFYVTASSRQARVLNRKVPVPVHDDDTAPLKGEVTVYSRSELDANGFYTLETWTLTLDPEMVGINQGTAWYDNGGGLWQLTGTRVREDRRPEAACRTLEEATYSGEGYFFTEWHTDSEVGGKYASLLLEAFFPQLDDNMGVEPSLHLFSPGRISGTQYSRENGTCVGHAFERDELRFGIPDTVPGKVAVRPSGKGVRFDYHQFEDNSTETEVDTYQFDVEGELAPARA